MIRNSIHTTRALLAGIGGRNIRPDLAWDAALCMESGFTGYQPILGEQDRSEKLN